MTIPKPVKREKAKPERKSRRKPRRIRKGGKAWQARECDRLWSLIIRSVQRCEAIGFDCKCGGVLQAAHIFPRTYRATRWLTANGLALCAGHHRWYHSHPIEFDRFVLGYAGADEVRRLGGIAVSGVKGAKVDVSQVLEFLRERARDCGVA